MTQNKTIWFVLNMDSRAHVGSEVFKSLGWLPVSKRVDQIILTIFLRSSRVNLQIIWSSILFQQVSFTHMSLDLGKLVVFYCNSKKFWKEIL